MDTHTEEHIHGGTHTWGRDIYEGTNIGDIHGGTHVEG